MFLNVPSTSRTLSFSMEEVVKKTCVLCGSISTGLVLTHEDTRFKYFHQLIVQSHQDGSQNPFYPWLESDRLQRSLEELKKKSFSVCEHCYGLANSALQQKEKTEEMKKEVNQLQNQLLQLLRKLQERVESYNEEMKKIERVVKKSELFVAYQPDQETRDQVQLVHSRINNLVTELNLFQCDLNNKIVSGGLPGFEKTSNDDTESSIENVEQISCEASMVEGPVDRTESLPDSFYRHSIFGSDDSNLSSNQSTGERPIKRRLKSVPTTATTFREGLIKRALEREQKRKNGDEFHENPLIRYYLRYDSGIQSFLVGHVQVQLSSTPLGDVLECGGIDCNARWVAPGNNECATTFDRDIRNHVIGKHLGGFTCRVCCLILNSYFKLMQHFKKEHPGQKPLTDDQFERFRASSSKKSPEKRPQGSSSASKFTNRFKRKSPQRLEKRPHNNDVASPSEGLKLVRFTMNNAIQSLGDTGASSTNSPYFHSQTSSFQDHPSSQTRATRKGL